MSKVLGRKLFKKQSSRGKGITSMLEDAPGYAEGGEVSRREMSAEERKRLAVDMLDRAKEEGFTFIEEGERPSLTRQAAVGAMPQMGPDPRAAQQLAMMQQMGMMPPRFQRGGLNDMTMGPGMGSPFEPPPMMVETPGATTRPFVPATPIGRAIMTPFTRPPSPEALRKVEDAVEAQRRAEAVTAAEEANPVPNIFSPVTDEELEAARKAQEEAVVRARLGVRSLTTGDPFEEAQQAGFESARGEVFREALKFPRVPDSKKETPPPPKGEEGGGREGEGGGATPVVTKADLLMEGIRSRREEMKAAREEAKGLALIQAGLAMAAGRSSNALSNIAAGGMSGIQALRESQRDIRKEERELMSDEMKLALAREQAAAERAYREATLGLRREELTASAGLRAAQAEYYKNLPGIQQAQTEQRRNAALLQAQLEAQKAVDAAMKSNPTLYVDAKGNIDTMRRDLEIKRRYDALVAGMTARGGFSDDPLGLRSTISPTGE